MASALTSQIKKRVKKRLKTGGYLAGKKKGKSVKLTNSKQGGIAVGAKHGPEGGIKGIVGTEGRPIEFEGEEIIITAPAVKDNTLREFEGQQLTNRQILSKINESGGGVSFADGGEIPGKIKSAKGKTYKVGGKIMTAKEVVEYCGCGCDHEAEKMATGGFAKKVTSISKSLIGQPVPKEYQSEYGKTYTKATAKQAATKIAGSIVRDEKMEKGGKLNKGVRIGDSIETPSLKYASRITEIIDYNGKKVAVWDADHYSTQWAFFDDIELTNSNGKIVSEKDWNKDYNHNYWQTTKFKHGKPAKYEKGGQIKKYHQVFIHPQGEGETQTWAIISYPEFDTINMFFSSADEAKKYADKNGIEVIEYSDSNKYGQLIEDFKKIKIPAESSLSPYKNNPAELIKFVQEQATGLTHGNRKPSWPPAYTSIVNTIGADLTNQAIALLPQAQKNKLIRFYQGKILPKELREAVKNKMAEGDEIKILAKYYVEYDPSVSVKWPLTKLQFIEKYKIEPSEKYYHLKGKEQFVYVSNKGKTAIKEYAMQNKGYAKGGQVSFSPKEKVMYYDEPAIISAIRIGDSSKDKYYRLTTFVKGEGFSKTGEISISHIESDPRLLRTANKQDIEKNQFEFDKLDSYAKGLRQDNFAAGGLLNIFKTKNNTPTVYEPSDEEVDRYYNDLVHEIKEYRPYTTPEQIGLTKEKVRERMRGSKMYFDDPKSYVQQKHVFLDRLEEDYEESFAAGGSTSPINVLSVIFNNNADFETAKQFFESEKSSFHPFFYNDEFRSIDFEVKGQEDADSTESGLSAELNQANISGYHFEAFHDNKMKKGGFVPAAITDRRDKTEYQRINTALDDLMGRENFYYENAINYSAEARQKKFAWFEEERKRLFDQQDNLLKKYTSKMAKGGEINRESITADLERNNTLDGRAREYKLLQTKVDFPNQKFAAGGSTETRYQIKNDKGGFFARMIPGGTNIFLSNAELGYLYTNEQAEDVKEFLEDTGYENLEIVPYVPQYSGSHFAKGGETLDEVQETAAKYGWTANKTDKGYQLFNRLGKNPANITLKPNGSYLIVDQQGKKLMSGKGQLPSSLEKVLKGYYYASEISFAKGGKLSDNELEIAEFNKNIKKIRPFTPDPQVKYLHNLFNSEEKEAAIEIAERLAGIIEKTPKTYETEDQETNDKMVYLHYFHGGSDWYIVEKDMEPQQLQAFGYVILNGDDINAEWGYISIEELKSMKIIELDFYFTPIKFGDLKKKWQEPEEEEEAEPVIEPPRPGTFLYGQKFDVPERYSTELLKELSERGFSIMKKKGQSVELLKNKHRFLVNDNGGEFNLIDLKTNEHIGDIPYDILDNVKREPHILAQDIQASFEKYYNDPHHSEFKVVGKDIIKFKDKETGKKILDETPPLYAGYDVTWIGPGYTQALIGEDVSAGWYAVKNTGKLPHKPLTLDTLSHYQKQKPVGISSEEIIYPNSQNEDELEIDETWDPVKGKILKNLFERYYETHLKEKFGIKGKDYDGLTVHLRFRFGEGSIDFSRNAEVQNYSPNEKDKLDRISKLILMLQDTTHEEALRIINSPDEIGTFAGQVSEKSARKAWKENTPIAEQFAKAGKPYPPFTKEHYANAFELNKAIEKLLDSKPNDDDFTAEEKSFIRYYSGYGGLEKFGATGKGLLYEYFTPSLISEKMWGLAYKYGFSGGRVLEPSAGIGEFIKYAPDQHLVTAHEINKYSARICKILYPMATVSTKHFEEIFIKNNDSIKGKISLLPKYQLVIGNPPYGEFGGKWAGMGEKNYTRASNYIDYFIFRGLDLLEPGGLLIFIVGAEVAAGGKPFLSQQMNKCKEEIMEKSELLDAYRLPNGVFERTDVLTDIIVLQKK